MPGVTSLVNPGVEGGKEVNLFYNTESAQLAVALKSGTGDDDPDTKVWTASSDDYQGIILNPSELDCDIYRGLSMVVAVTKPFLSEGSQQTFNNISLVSPVYQKLAQTALQNNKVAVCSSDRSAWVYYLDGTGAGNMSIKEYSMDSGTVQSYQQNQDIVPNCSLAAWYAPTTQQRWVVYQEINNGNLKVLNVNTKQAEYIGSTGDSNNATSVCATMSRNAVYIYYTDNHWNLRKLGKDLSIPGQSWNDLNPHSVDGSPKVDPTSQLSVVTANGYNHIFYIAQNTNKVGFTHIRDPL